MKFVDRLLGKTEVKGGEVFVNPSEEALTLRNHERMIRLKKAIDKMAERGLEDTDKYKRLVKNLKIRKLIMEG